MRAPAHSRPGCTSGCRCRPPPDRCRRPGNRDSSSAAVDRSSLSEGRVVWEMPLLLRRRALHTRGVVVAVVAVRVVHVAADDVVDVVAVPHPLVTTAGSVLVVGLVMLAAVTVPALVLVPLADRNRLVHPAPSFRSRLAPRPDERDDDRRGDGDHGGRHHRVRDTGRESHVSGLRHPRLQVWRQLRDRVEERVGADKRLARLSDLVLREACLPSGLARVIDAEAPAEGAEERDVERPADHARHLEDASCGPREVDWNVADRGVPRCRGRRIPRHPRAVAPRASGRSPRPERHQCTAYPRRRRHARRRAEDHSRERPRAQTELQPRKRSGRARSAEHNCPQSCERNEAGGDHANRADELRSDNDDHRLRTGEPELRVTPARQHVRLDRKPIELDGLTQEDGRTDEADGRDEQNRARDPTVGAAEHRRRSRPRARAGRRTRSATVRRPIRTPSSALLRRRARVRGPTMRSLRTVR
jgi:hypothetical protein